MQPRRALKNRRSQSRGGGDDVLAIIEHQQHPLISEPGKKAAHRIVGADLHPDRGSDGARHQARIAERRKIDQPNPMLVGLDQRFGNRQRERGFADPAGSDDGQQAVQP